MFAILRNRMFARLWAGQTISYFGDWLNIAAVLSLLAFRWQVPPLTLSLFGLTMAIPWLVLGPVAGVFADRWNRKATMIIFDLIRAVAVLGYVVAADVMHVYATAFVMAVSGVFFVPSRLGTIRQIVPREDLLPANSLSTFSMQATKIIGPAVGGLIVAAWGEAVCFWANSASFVVSALIIATVALPDHRSVDASASAAPAAARRSFTAEFAAGLAHIVRTRVILFTVILIAFCHFCIVMFDSVAGILIRENFGAAPRTLGLILGAIGLGTALSTLWIGNRGKLYSRQGLSALGALWVGSALCLVVLFSAFGGPVAMPGAVVFACLVGAGVSLLTIPASTTIQVETPQEMMGRVGGTFDSL